jgi:hypothetical protein
MRTTPTFFLILIMEHPMDTLKSNVPSRAGILGHGTENQT